jgi:hypothetical protein
VPKELAFDAADDVGGELGRALGITAVDGANDSERRNLHQILVTLRGVADSAGELARQRKVRLDHAPSLRLEPPPLRRHARMLRACARFCHCFSKSFWITRVAGGYVSP